MLRIWWFLIQFRSFPMHCNCETMKPLVTLVLSKPWFLSVVFGYKHFEKLRDNNFFFGLWKITSQTISINEKSLYRDLSCIFLYVRNCMKSVWLAFFHLRKLYEQHFWSTRASQLCLNILNFGHSSHMKLNSVFAWPKLTHFSFATLSRKIMPSSSYLLFFLHLYQIHYDYLTKNNYDSNLRSNRKTKTPSGTTS